jgi:hypothetical protein
MIMPRGKAGRYHVMFIAELETAKDWGRIANSPSGTKE